MTDTLIGDADGLYHPLAFQRPAAAGTMSEAELHALRARLEGGIRNKAARGELRRGLPVGFVWGDGDGEVLRHPDAAVSAAVRAFFERFAEFGSARGVWQPGAPGLAARRFVSGMRRPPSVAKRREAGGGRT